MHLTLMRHGLPVRDAVDAADPGLDPTGREQALAAATLLRRGTYDAVYSSPQLRARQTADVMAEALALPVALDDGLVEFDHGAPYVHYDNADAAVWQSYFRADLSPWGLTAAEFHARIARTLDSIANRHPSGRVLAVCHGGVVNAWACQVLGVPDRIRVMEPAYASMHSFERRAGRWRVVSLNQVVPVDSPFTLGVE